MAYINLLQNLNIGNGAAVTFAENLTSFPVANSIGQLTFVNGVLYIWSLVAGVTTWYPLTKAQAVYVHTQGVASVTWTVTHNLATQNIIFMIYDVNNEVQQAQISNMTDNSFTVNLSVAILGRCVVFAATQELAPILASNITVGNTTLNGSTILVNSVDIVALLNLKAPSLNPVFSGTVTVPNINGNVITTGTGTLTLSAGSSLINAGANALTLTTTGTTNTTLPAGSHTAAVLDVEQTFTAVQLMNPTTTSSSSYTWNCATDPNLTLTTTGNLTMNAPTNLTPGAFYCMLVTYGGTHTISWNTNFKGVSNITASSTSGVTDIFAFRASSSSILMSVGYRLNIGA